MIVPGLRTPRITAHRCEASMTTPTPLRLQALHQEVGDLLGHPLLYLQASRVHLDDARDLGQADDPTFGDVRDRRLAEERQQVVLAQAVERDVLDDHHLAVVDIEDGVVDQPLGIDVIAGGQLAVHAPHRAGRFREAVAVGILAHLDQDLAYGSLDRLARDEPSRRASPIGRVVAILADLLLDLLDQLAHLVGQGPIHH